LPNPLHKGGTLHAEGNVFYNAVCRHGLRSGLLARQITLHADTCGCLFNADGKLRKELPGLLRALNPDRKPNSLRDGGIAVGQDGNIYMLNADRITVVSAAGEISRRMTYKKPVRDLTAQGLAVSGGLIAITLLQQDNGRVIPRFLVVGSDDGRSFGYYTLPDEFHNPLALCFSRDDGITFLKLQPSERRLTFINAPLR
jgi:hypothetical protein